MSEPKFKVRQNVLLTNGSTMRIDSMDYILWNRKTGEREWEYYGSDTCAERYIVGVVKITPVNGDVYCKDCKHCEISEPEHDREYGRKLEFRGCPISNWFEGVWFVDSDFYEYGGYIADLETMQPPACANCFEPKEAE